MLGAKHASRAPSSKRSTSRAALRRAQPSSWAYVNRRRSRASPEPSTSATESGAISAASRRMDEMVVARTGSSSVAGQCDSCIKNPATQDSRYRPSVWWKCRMRLS